MVEGKADTVAACVKELGDQIIGQAASNIEDIWQQLYRGGFYRGGPILMSALAGIDQALWDIKGKELGVPIYELLGGAVRSRMKMYCWIGGDDPSELAASAKAKANEGYTAIKMNASGSLDWIDSSNQIAGINKRAREVRDAVGDEFGIGIDFHGRIHKSMARSAIDSLGDVRPMFVEEPLLPEHMKRDQEWLRHSTIPIATGERLFSRWDFRELFESALVDIAQPDLSHAGGISEVRRIAAAAEAYDIALAPHCPLGPISLAAALQVDFACLNAVIQESSLGIHYNEGLEMTDYLVDAGVFALENGCINRLRKPGLGIEINEELVKEAAKDGHNWHNPIWRNSDSSFTEW